MSILAELLKYLFLPPDRAPGLKAGPCTITGMLEGEEVCRRVEICPDLRTVDMDSLVK